MNIFYVPLNKPFFGELVAGVQAKFHDKSAEINRQVQYVVFSKQDERSLKELFGACGDESSTVTNLAYDDVDNARCWPIDLQLELASVMISQASEQTGLQPSSAIALALELLKIALQCKADSFSLDNLQEMRSGNAPQHIENLIKHIPSAMRVLKDFDITNNIDEGSFVSLDPRIRKNDCHKSPMIILAPDRISDNVVRIIKELMQYDAAHLALKPIDMAMSNDCWKQLNDAHPSFQQKQLLDQLEITIDQVLCLTKANDASLVSMLFHPADYVAKWSEMFVPNVGNTQYVECRSIREEGLVALIKAKQMLSITGKPVSIICDDDKTIKVLLSLSKLFELNINVAHGLPLRDTNHINFLELVFQASYMNFAPAHLIALLKHKLFGSDMSMITLLETKYLRGLCRYNGLDELIAMVKEPNLAEFLHSLYTRFAALLVLIRKESVEFSSLLLAVVNVATRCSHGVPAYDFLHTQHHKIRIATSEFLSTLHSLIATHRTTYNHALNNERAQVVIIPSSESLACLHDNVIITGMNEGKAVADDGLLPIISKFIGMYNIETSEHKRTRNLFYLLHKPNVFLTRTCMLSGSPQVPSRWLVRLKLLEEKAKLDLNAQVLIDEVEALFIPKEQTLYNTPAPAPKLTPRLTKLSVTQVEQLMRDPYSVYAKQLLRLKPIDELDRKPTQADFGQFVHACINAFSKNYDSSLNDKEHALKFSQYAEAIAARMLSKTGARRLWMIRIERIKEWAINFERTRQNKKIYTEVRGTMNIPLANNGKFMLTCVADRIEVEEDRVSIIDFKTGTIPSDKDVASYMSPQLPLEAMILMHGGFEGISSSLHLQRLTYVKLGASSQFGKTTDIKGDLQKIVNEAKRGLIALIEYYNEPNTQFAVAKFGKPSSYAHLERLDELRQ